MNVLRKREEMAKRGERQGNNHSPSKKNSKLKYQAINPGEYDFAGNHPNANFKSLSS